MSEADAEACVLCGGPCLHEALRAYLMPILARHMAEQFKADIAKTLEAQSLPTLGSHTRKEA